VVWLCTAAAGDSLPQAIMPEQGSTEPRVDGPLTAKQNSYHCTSPSSPSPPPALPPGVVALRAGAAAGLAVLLGAEVAAGSCGEWTAALMAAAASPSLPPRGRPPGILVGTSGGGGGGASPSSWGLLAGGVMATPLPRLQLARRCLRALEQAAALLPPSAAGSAAAGGVSSTAAAVAAVTSASTMPLASWLLAAVCVSAQGGGSATSSAAASGAAASSSTLLPPLSAYPAAGALRPLAERALAYAAAQPGGGGGDATALPAALEVAAAVRCLAAAPRLPAADWVGLCSCLLSAAPVSPPLLPAGHGGGDRDAAAAWTAAHHQQQDAGISLLLAHAAEPGAAGFASLLDALLCQAGMRSLPGYLQARLLAQLDVAVVALPLARGAALLDGLPALLTAAATGAEAAAGLPLSSPPSSSSLLLLEAAWIGLGRLCRAAADGTPPMVPAGAGRDGSAGPLRDALAAAVTGLAAALPPLPERADAGPVQLLAAACVPEGLPAAALARTLDEERAEACWYTPVQRAAGAAGHADGGGAAADGGALPGSLRVWRAALSCLRQLNPDELLRATASADPGAAAAAATTAAVAADTITTGAAAPRMGVMAPLLAASLRCMLVLSGKLSWKDLRSPSLTLLRSAAGIAQRTQEQVQHWAAGVSPTMLVAALAAGSAPQAGLQQHLREVVDAALQLAAADAAAVLVSATLTSWLWWRGAAISQSADSGGSGRSAAAATAMLEMQLALAAGADGALAALPGTLSVLVYVLPLCGSRAAFAEAVCSLLLDLAGARLASTSTVNCLHAAAAAVREALPPGGDVWARLAAVDDGRF
jgi:hypothetical protein